MKKKIPVILSVDTGVDDAVSIILALQAQNIDIKLIVCSHGNTNIKNVIENTLGVLELINAPSIPVMSGVMPSKKRQSQLFNAHGNNGLGGYTLPPNKRELSTGNVENVIYDLACREDNLHYVNLGPSTTLATAIEKYPDLSSKIKRVIFMGGSITEKLNTTTPYTEYNVASDPESADLIIKSGIKILMVPTEMGRTAFLDYYDIYKTKKLNKTGEILEQIFRNYKHRKLPHGVATCDSTAVLSLTHPEIMTIKPVFGFVQFFKDLDTGVCLFDFSKEPNMEVVTDINVTKFKKVYFKLLSKLP